MMTTMATPNGTPKPSIRREIATSTRSGRAFIAGLEDTLQQMDTHCGWGNHSVAYFKSLEVTRHIWESYCLANQDANLFTKVIIDSQLIRCATSVSANIAEGLGRAGRRQTLQFYKTARGSLFETYCFLRQMPPPYSTTILSETKEVCEELDKEIRVLIDALIDDAKHGRLDV